MLLVYNNCKIVITNATYHTLEEKEGMQEKLDVFLLNNRLTSDEYNELTAMLAAKPIVA